MRNGTGRGRQAWGQTTQYKSAEGREGAGPPGETGRNWNLAVDTNSQVNAKLKGSASSGRVHAGKFLGHINFLAQAPDKQPLIFVAFP